jgi:serine protease SohB
MAHLMEHLFDYLEFLAKVATVAVGFIVVIGFAMSLRGRQAGSDDGHLEIVKINDRLQDMSRTLRQAILPPPQFKRSVKREEKARKREMKRDNAAAGRRRVFVLDFDGDLQASKVGQLRNEVTAVLTGARDSDEVLVRIESPGGMVHGYGLAASQLERVRGRNIRLVAAIDKVAASGGYLMASVADHIIAAPFALVGSIGVVAQIPNVHRLLKKHDVDVEVLTAGKYKRTLTIFGENTEQGRAKFLEELEDVHRLFQEFVGANRPQVSIDEIATGEAWYGRRALDHHLVDELSTSDAYLLHACEDADVFEVHWLVHKKPLERLVAQFVQAVRDAAARMKWS